MDRKSALNTLNHLNSIHIRGGRWTEAEMRLYAEVARVIRTGA